MAANTSPIFEATPRILGIQILPADTTTLKSFGTIGSNGTRIDEVFISSTDTAAMSVNFYINDGSADHYIGTVAVAAGAGYTSVARKDAMAVLSPILGYIVVPSSYLLKASVVQTVTSAKVLDVVAMGGDY